MCRWNCEKLAEAIRNAVPLSQTTPKLALFDSEFARHYLSKMRAKLGARSSRCCTATTLARLLQAC